MSIEENISKLQKLLDAGVINQQEFDIKKAELTSEPTEEELSELNELLKDGLISKEEMEALKVKKKKEAAVANASKETIATPVEPVTSTSFLKKNLVFLIIIAALVAIVGVLGSQSASKQAEINDLQDKIRQQNTSIDNYKAEASGYEDFLTEFYLNNAVVLIEGDYTYYHRYKCPDTPMATGPYRFKVLTPMNAENEGYQKCPTCFGIDEYEYCSC